MGPFSICCMVFLERSMNLIYNNPMLKTNVRHGKSMHQNFFLSGIWLWGSSPCVARIPSFLILVLTFLRNGCVYPPVASMCIPMEVPFLDSLFVYVRNNKLDIIEYSSNMEGFAFIFISGQTKEQIEKVPT